MSSKDVRFYIEQNFHLLSPHDTIKMISLLETHDDNMSNARDEELDLNNSFI